MRLRLSRMPSIPGVNRRRLVYAALAIAALAGLVVAVCAPAIAWLPDPGGATTRVLGPLLAAQAAIAALTLAVTLFALERVSARPDADDRVFRKYVERSRMWHVLLGSLAAVGVTGVVLLSGEFAAGGVPIAMGAPGLANVMLVAVLAFIASVVLPVVLFERAVRLVRPSTWRELRRDVNEEDVRSAVRAFVRRRQREREALQADDPDLEDIVPEPDESSADEAIQALRDDARKAMDERRHQDFAAALDSITELLELAMDEIKGHGISCEQPGEWAEWPPLAELQRNLYSFREDVLRRGDRDHALELSRFDSGLVQRGLEQRCGELFTAALGGHELNYEIASRTGNHELRVQLGRVSARDVGHSVLLESDEEMPSSLPYLREWARRYGRLLFRAMRGGHVDDFRLLRADLREVLRTVRRRAARGLIFDWDPRNWMEPAEQDGRMMLMQLGGLAVQPAALGGVADPQPYLDVMREEHDELLQLVDDVPRSIAFLGSAPFLWSDLVDPEIPATGVRVGDLTDSDYALPFFALRALELATDPMPELDLRGQARYVLDRFESSARAVEQHVRIDGDLSFEQRLRLVLEALHVAADKEADARDTQP